MDRNTSTSTAWLPETWLAFPGGWGWSVVVTMRKDVAEMLTAGRGSIEQPSRLFVINIQPQNYQVTVSALGFAAEGPLLREIGCRLQKTAEPVDGLIYHVHHEHFALLLANRTRQECLETTQRAIAELQRPLDVWDVPVYLGAHAGVSPFLFHVRPGYAPQRGRRPDHSREHRPGAESRPEERCRRGRGRGNPAPPRGMCCDAVQGHGIARPMPAAELLRWSAQSIRQRPLAEERRGPGRAWSDIDGRARRERK